MQEEWFDLHNWAENVYKSQNWTVQEFLSSCDLPITAEYVIYFFHHMRFHWWTEFPPDSVRGELLIGLRNARQNGIHQHPSHVSSEAERALNLYCFNKTRMREAGIFTCFFEDLYDGHVGVLVLIDQGGDAEPVKKLLHEKFKCVYTVRVSTPL